MTEATEPPVPAEVGAEPTADPETAAPKRRAVRRPSKPDAVLAAATEVARRAIVEIAGDSAVGEHLGVVAEAERLVTHRFMASVPGYGGWHWFATLARVPRGKDATVCEAGLLPSEDALLAPAWVPWSERVRPEDAKTADGETDSDSGVETVIETSGEQRGLTMDAVDFNTADAAVVEPSDNSEATNAPGGEPPVA